MASQGLRYDKMVEGALRGVVRSAISHAAEHGLPGAHHFYVTFDTQSDGVEIADSLRSRYPDEMTIVLQHQYWDLAVNDDGFEVTLTFNKLPHHLVIPFQAVTAFFDPSVQFGLKFQPMEGEGASGSDQPAANSEEGEAAAAARDAETDADQQSTGDVVALDAFRKNKS